MAVNSARNLNSINSNLTFKILGNRRRNLVILSENWTKGFAKVNSGDLLKSASIYDESEDLIYSAIAFDTKALFITLEVSNGGSPSSNFLNDFPDTWNKIESIVRYKEQIVIIPVFNSVQYVFIFE